MSGVPWSGQAVGATVALAAAGIMREWCARVDGEIVMCVTGPDAEAMCRAVPGALVAYRLPERPTAANGYQLNGPWIDVE